MKFSIIICTLNSVQSLSKTLNSILTQTHNDYEVVIVDGVSTDGTREMIVEYEKKFFGKLRWISESDNGLYDAMNKGVRTAKGEFLLVVGAGDWIERDALENARKCIEGNPDADAVYGKTRIWDKNLQNNHTVQTSVKDLPILPMQHPSLVYKKTLHDRFWMYDEKYRIVADYVFCIKAFYLGGTSVFPFDSVVDNFVMDGMSSKNRFGVLLENIRARREYGMKTYILREFKFYIKNLIK